MAGRYTLYGGEISYFTGKARAYLRNKGIPYEERAATREVYKEIILPRVGWPVVPVVITPEGNTLQDTTDIIDALEAVFPDASVYPAGPRQHLTALLLEVFGDEWLKIPAMHYRWNRNTDWIIEQFGRLSNPHATAEEARAIGEKNCKPFRGSLPALGVTDATIPAVEASYEALLHELDTHFAKHDFLLGARPCIGDYGLIGPLYAHQYRDPASGELMRRIGPSVAAWVERMMEGTGLEERRRGAGSDWTGEDRRSAAGDDAEFLPNDEVPATLMPVLERMVSEYFPVLASQIRRFDAWADANPGAEVPRAVGMHTFTLGTGTATEVSAERAAFTFDLWMFQRPRDYIAGLSWDARDQAIAFTNSFGATELLTQPMRHRLVREHFRLALAA